MGDTYDAARSTVASGTQGVQREQWKQVRTHIHHYEEKLLELQFDYQQKVNGLEALKLELRQLLKDSHDCEEEVRKMAMYTHDTYKQLQEMDMQLRTVDQDRIMLAQQLLSEQDGLKADIKKSEDTKASFSQHLEAQHEHILKLQQAHQVVQPPTGTQQLPEQQQMDADCGACKDVMSVQVADSK